MQKGSKMSEESKKKISEAKKGKRTIPCSENRRKAISEAKKGVPVPEERKEKIRQALKGRKNAEHSLKLKKLHAEGKIVVWNKGKIYGTSRSSNLGKYKVWKTEVHERDNHKCMKCGSTKKLHAHHIIPWNEDETKRFDIDNGITVCNRCHTKTEAIHLRPGYVRPIHNTPHTEESKRKMSEALKGKASWNKGKNLSEEHKKKLKEAKLGHIPWNKGLRQENPSHRICVDCNIEKTITEFTPQRDWFKNRCKACRNTKLKLKRKISWH